MNLSLLHFSPLQLAGLLQWPADYHTAILDKKYYTFYLSKKTGGKRKIDAPGKTLKDWQKSIGHVLMSYYAPHIPVSVHGYIPEDFSTTGARHILSHARVHLHHRYLVSLDLEDFFTSIHRDRIRASLLGLVTDIHPDTLDLIEEGVTFEDHLPMGSPASPVISNIVCLELDNTLEQMASKEQLFYSRYVDDLSFSSDTAISPEQIQLLRDIILRQGFIINEEKFRTFGPTDPKYITGLILDQGVIRVQEELLDNLEKCIKEFRQVRWLASQLGKDDPTLKYKARHMRTSISGQLRFLKHIQGEENKDYIELASRFEKVLKYSKPKFDFYI